MEAENPSKVRPDKYVNLVFGQVLLGAAL